MTTLDEINPDPETVRVKGPEPAGVVVGLIDETAGVGVVPPPPVPPELELPPPQPIKSALTPRPKTQQQNFSIFIVQKLYVTIACVVEKSI